MTTAHGSHLATQHFLDALYGPDATDWLTIFTVPGEHTEWFRGNQHADAAAYAVTQAATRDVYFGVGLRQHRLPSGRGAAQDVSVIPGLWMDFDLQHPTRKRSNLPPSLDDMLALTRTIPQPPSLVVHSGYGVHAYWLFRELWRFSDPEERQRAGHLLRRLQTTFQAAAKVHGWHLDSTFSLDHVLRLPGTLNHKQSDDPKPPYVMRGPDIIQRYNPHEFDENLVELDPPQDNGQPFQDEGADLPTVDVEMLDIPTWLKYLIAIGRDPDYRGKHPSRSEAHGHATEALLKAGIDELTILSLLLDSRYGISERPREKGRAWVVGDIARLKAKMDGRQSTSATPPGTESTAGDTNTGGAPPANEAEQGPSQSSHQKPTIKITTQMTAVVSRMQAAIRRYPSGPFLYQRAHQLSIIVQGAKPPKWLRRATDAPLIHPADKAYIREIASFAATWKRWDARKETDVKALPPAWAIETLMARPRWSFPPLEGIICAPTLRPDGSILDAPGYDQDTGLYLHLDQAQFPPIPQHPTSHDACLGVAVLREIFSDFPFLEAHHYSAALAAVLSLVARFTIQGKVPFFAVRSTTRGAGKGLLIDAISVIATGRHAPRWAQTLDEEEERKRLITIAMSGDAVLHIDNITHPLGSGPLDMAMTAEAITERIMATHAERTAPIKAVFFGSGNNMVFQSDMARRVVPIDLAPAEERPDERENFRHHPLLAWILEQRPRLVTAALTIVKAYIEAGRPRQTGIKAFGSYEEWSDLIRQSLMWAGEPDPCAGRGDIEAESDPKYEMQKVVLIAWHERYGEVAKTLKEVKDDIDNHTARDLDDRDKWTGRWITDPAWRDLQAALLSLSKRGNEINTTAIGTMFRTWQGRVLANLQLRKAGQDRFGAIQWQVKKLTG